MNGPKWDVASEKTHVTASRTELDREMTITGGHLPNLCKNLGRKKWIVLRAHQQRGYLNTVEKMD